MASKKKDKDRLLQVKVEIEEANAQQKKVEFPPKEDSLDQKQEAFLKEINRMLEETKRIQKDVARDIDIETYEEVIRTRESVLLETLLLIYVQTSKMNSLLKLPISLLLASIILDKLAGKEEVIEHITYHYEDMHSVIEKAMDSIDDIEKAMEDTLQDISYLRKDYVKKYADYQGISEYDDLFSMLDTTEKVLEKELGKVEGMEKDLDKSLEENNQKVLTIQKSA